MDKKEALHIAKLARLKFDESSLEKIAGDMHGILEMVDILQNADTSKVKNIAADSAHLRTRKDEVTVSNLSQDLVKNAPDAYEHYFTVPKVVE